MYSFLVLFVLVTITNTGVDAIVKGVHANITEAPSTVMIRHRLLPDSIIGQICAGSIISNKHILTTAHCIPNLNFAGSFNLVAPSFFHIVPGVNSYDFNTTITYEIGKIHYHPNFTGEFTDAKDRADLAVITLENEIPFSPTQQTIQLASESPANRSEGRIFGWGYTVPGVSSHSPTLVAASMTILDISSCKKTAPNEQYAKDELCVIGNGGSTSCDADSGGPLIVNGQLAGVIVNQEGCRAEVPPGSIINVAYHKSWIENIIKSEKNTTP